MRVTIFYVVSLLVVSFIVLTPTIASFPVPALTTPRLALRHRLRHCSHRRAAFHHERRYPDFGPLGRQQCVYAASRTLQAWPPSVRLRASSATSTDWVVPLPAVILSLIFGLLGFLIYASDDARGQVFNWLLAISGLSSIISWLCICIAHARFRLAWARAGHTLEESPGSRPSASTVHLRACFNVLVICFTFYVSAFPSARAR